MKECFLTLLLALSTACGQETSPPRASGVDISRTAIVWQGPVNDDAYILQVFNETATCLAPHGFSRPGFPTVVVVQDPFLCNDARNVGCTSFSKDTIYVYSGVLHGIPILAHEFVHWITLQGDDAHTQPFFLQCGVLQVPSEAAVAFSLSPIP